MDEIKEIVDKVLRGIDLTEIESEDGWWETSTGAEFGKQKKELLIATLRSHLTRHSNERAEACRCNRQPISIRCNNCGGLVPVKQPAV